MTSEESLRIGIRYAKPAQRSDASGSDRVNKKRSQVAEPTFVDREAHKQFVKNLFSTVGKM